MEWQVKIEGQNKKRILVTFIPEGEMIVFKGQYSIKNHWVDFSIDNHSMDISLDDIQTMLGRVYDEMEKRLRVYEDLDKSFKMITNIEIPEEI